jgi:hypothetical protein
MNISDCMGFYQKRKRQWELRSSPEEISWPQADCQLLSEILPKSDPIKYNLIFERFLNVTGFQAGYRLDFCYA